MKSERVVLGPVDCVEALLESIQQLSGKNPDHLLLFRGQNNLHPTIRSGLARGDVRLQPDVEQGWSALAGKILGHKSPTSGNVPFRKAVLQHYGVKTHYVDLTSDPEIAAWFACNKLKSQPTMYAGSPIRKIDRLRYTRRQDGLGYVLVLSFPEPQTLTAGRRLFDISTLEPVLRPRRQKAWLAYDRRPFLPDPNDFWVATVAIDCSRFVSNLSSDFLFPLPGEDAGYGILLDTPFVEFPDAWLSRDEGEEVKKTKHHFRFGLRALTIPEYVHSEGTDEYNHKWNDQTLTETEPMQTWVSWDFDLATDLPGITGNIKECTKITLSPRARSILYRPPADVRLQWPN